MTLGNLIEKLQKLAEDNPDSKNRNVVFYDVGEIGHQFEMLDNVANDVFVGRVSCLISIQKEKQHIDNWNK